MVVTIDLDMTVADHRTRLTKACANGSIDRSVLLCADLIQGDKVIAGAHVALELIRKTYSIIFLSSRSRAVTEATRRWLKSHGLLSKTDRLLVVDSEVEKLRHIKRLLPRIYLIIDDFKYDYQSGKPKVSDYLLPELLALRAPVVIFDHNWRRIIKTYFSDYIPARKNAQRSRL